ncbi:uncharacterized protein LOC131174073 [Hevea brasiliensis]|uniref:uncharacterized protein LOC131174073 n=1 Tax=Hevea brasiliensis TaxID=3981 RepID=UPI0025E0F63C|nr:uncharacterized protein LOC131174073 [Hevea brasiliensis]
MILVTNNARISILINGSPSEEILMKNGLSQGDALSPFLLNIAVKPLSLMIEEACSLGWLEGAFVSESLRVNFHKSAINGVNVEDELLISAALLACCKIGNLPFRYLGLPLGANPKRASTSLPIVRKIKDRLAFWKGKFLSAVDHLTLIKSCLSNLTICHLSIFKIPKCIATKI